MKCSEKYCKEHLEGDTIDLLKKGYGYCKHGHKTDLPGTQQDFFCECGAKTTNQPAHSWWCKEFKEK